MATRRITCPHCRQNFGVAERQEVNRCPSCGVELRFVPAHWEWREPAQAPQPAHPDRIARPVVLAEPLVPRANARRAGDDRPWHSEWQAGGAPNAVQQNAGGCLLALFSALGALFR